MNGNVIMINLKKIVKKKAIKNGFWMYLLQIFNTVVPLLTLPYITRVLGADQYGVFSFAVNILGYFQVVVEYGFGMSATRKIALSDKRNDQINKTFTTVLLSRTFMLFICTAITIIYYFTSKDNLTQCLCLIIMMIGLIGNCIQLNWLFQGMQQMQFISIINILSRTISVLLIFICVKRPTDLYIYCVLYSISPLFNGILGIIIAKKQYSLKLVKINLQDVIYEMKEGWYVFTTQLSSKVFGAIGITFLGIFSSSYTVGVYSAINKIPQIIILAWTPISQVMYPISSKEMKKSFSHGRAFIRKIQIPFVLLASFGAIVISIFSSQIVKIAFGQEYVNYAYWIIPLLAWIVLAINNNFLGVQTLLGSGRDKEYSKCFQVGVVCTIVFNFVLIYLFGGNGACMAPLISELILGILLYREIRKIKI